ncbi:hypothetical protein HK102_012620 [Quaeritorhiza haematococci]|nr:hypothetical protein HK102_012620 [Quaeritorhiza haematococci]
MGGKLSSHKVTPIEQPSGKTAKSPVAPNRKPSSSPTSPVQPQTAFTSENIPQTFEQTYQRLLSASPLSFSSTPDVYSQRALEAYYRWWSQQLRYMPPKPNWENAAASAIGRVLKKKLVLSGSGMQEESSALPALKKNETGGGESDGDELFVYDFVPSASAASRKGTILLMNEWLERADEMESLIKSLLSANYRVLALEFASPSTNPANPSPQPQLALRFLHALVAVSDYINPKRQPIFTDDLTIVAHGVAGTLVLNGMSQFGLLSSKNDTDPEDSSRPGSPLQKQQQQLRVRNLVFVNPVNSVDAYLRTLAMQIRIGKAATDSFVGKASTYFGLDMTKLQATSSLETLLSSPHPNSLNIHVIYDTKDTTLPPNLHGKPIAQTASQLQLLQHGSTHPEPNFLETSGLSPKAALRDRGVLDSIFKFLTTAAAQQREQQPQPQQPHHYHNHDHNHQQHRHQQHQKQGRDDENGLPGQYTPITLSEESLLNSTQQRRQWHQEYHHKSSPRPSSVVTKKTIASTPAASVTPLMESRSSVSSTSSEDTTTEERKHAHQRPHQGKTRAGFAQGRTQKDMSREYSEESHPVRAYREGSGQGNRVKKDDSLELLINELELEVLAMT